MLIKTDDKYILSIPPVLDAVNLSKLFDHLDIMVSGDVREVVLDCSHIADVSSRYLAVLCQIHSEMKAAGIPVHLESVSDKLREALNDHDALIPMEQSQNIGKDEGKFIRCGDGRGKREIKMRFGANSDDIMRVFDVFEAFLVNNEIYEIETFELITVFYEVATNIRLHANLGVDARIEFSAKICEQEILMKFEDPGVAFDPSMQLSHFDPVNALKTGKMRGLGVILINRLIDSLYYMRSEDKKNILSLKKMLRQGGGKNDSISNNK